MLSVTVSRFSSTPLRTLGRLTIDGSFQCYTLEDAQRTTKIKGQTAIPAGTYKLALRDSPRFGKDTLWLRDVPGFEWILIHGGNTERDTEGCILVGEALADWDKEPGPDAIVRSQAALKALRAILVPRLKKGETIDLVVA